MYVSNLQVAHSTQMGLTSNAPCSRCGQAAGVLVQIRYYASAEAAREGEWTAAAVCRGCVDVFNRANGNTFAKAGFPDADLDERIGNRREWRTRIRSQAIAVQT